MKRGLFILVFGLLAAAATYVCVYVACMSPARELQRSKQPELAWLKKEFKLSEAEFKRISELHAAYLPHCREMCRKIEAQNVHLQRLVLSATNMTPEIETALAEASGLRSECHAMMLKHFFQVSQAMPPKQAHRYLSWAKDRASVPDYGMNSRR